MHASRALTATQAAHYYETEYSRGDYYTRGEQELPGYWHGRAAEELGLRGPVRAGDFSALLTGVHPRSREVLVAARLGLDKRRAGWDFQISADKTVSIAALVGGDRRLLKTHDAAVRVAVTAVERYSQAWVKGGRDTERTGRIVAGIFQHESSRNLDPHLHSHVVVMNMTRRGDGEWRALQEQGMFRVQRLGTAVYRAEMAVSIRRLGYRLEVTRTGEVRIAGLTEDQRGAFSTRRADILRWCARNRTAPARKGQEAAHATRAAKNPGVDRAEVYRAWRDRARALRVDFQGLRQGVRERAVQLAQTAGLSGLPGVAVQAEEALTLAIEHVSERHSVLRLDQVECAALRWGLSWGVQLKHLHRALEGQRDIHFAKDGLRLTTKGLRNDEAKFLRLEREGRGKASAILLFTDFGGRSLSLEQRQAAQLVLESRDRVVGIEGKAGTGKSYVVREIAREAEAVGWMVRGFAPTGRAAELLSAAGIRSQTVESLLCEKRVVRAARELWVVDEAGLLDSRRARALLERAASANAKVVLVGDRAQHRAVEAGVPYAQLVDEGMRTATLRQIQRQKDPGLREVVEHLSERRVGCAVRLLGEQKRIVECRHGNLRHSVVANAYCERPIGTLVIAPSNDERSDLNRRIRDELKSKGRIRGREMEVEVSVSRGLTNTEKRHARSYDVADILTFHRRLRRYGIEAGETGRVMRVDTEKNRLTLECQGRTIGLSPRRIRSFDVGRVETRVFASGDRLAFRESFRQAGIRNGSLGTVERVGPERRKADVRLDDGRIASLDLRRPVGVDYGYAVTSHKSQGETVDRVLVVVDTQHSPTLVNQQQAYVSISRAREDAHIYTDDHARLLQSWGRDASGDQRAMDLSPIRPEVREWQRKATAEEQSAQKNIRRGDSTPESFRSHLYECQQRQRIDVDPDLHFAEVRKLEELRKALCEARADRAGIREAYEAQRNRIYELRHGTDRSSLGPQPRLAEWEELTLHQAQRSLGSDSPLTKNALARLDATELRKAVKKLVSLAAATKRMRESPGSEELRKKLLHGTHQVAETARISSRRRMS